MKGFVTRHIGPRENEVKEMLTTIGANSIDELIDNTVPENIRSTKPMDIPAAVSEAEQLEHMQYLAALNEDRASYIGMGYYGTIIPPVIQRNILENPGWYTAYTPYQAEISQGRLEALLNFQTMVSDLTGMEFEVNPGDHLPLLVGLGQVTGTQGVVHFFPSDLGEKTAFTLPPAPPETTLRFSFR